MTNENNNETNNEIILNKGDLIYWSRCMPNVGIYDVIDLKVRTVTDTYFVGIETKTKHAYLFYNKDLDMIVFMNRKDAVMNCAEKENNSKRKVSDEKYYEEY